MKRPFSGPKWRDEMFLGGVGGNITAKLENFIIGYIILVNLRADVTFLTRIGGDCVEFLFTIAYGLT